MSSSSQYPNSEDATQSLPGAKRLCPSVHKLLSNDDPLPSTLSIAQHVLTRRVILGELYPMLALMKKKLSYITNNEGSGVCICMKHNVDERALEFMK